MIKLIAKKDKSMSNVECVYWLFFFVLFLFLDVNWCVKPGMFFLCAVRY